MADPQASGLAEFDVMRRRIQSDSVQREQKAQDALKRRLATQGMLNSGTYGKESERVAREESESTQRAIENLDVQEIREKQRRQEIAEGRQYQTSERLGSQEFGAGQNALQRAFAREERMGGQEFAGSQNALQRAFAKEERIGGQDFAGQQNALQRAFARGEREGSERFATLSREAGERYQSAEARARETFESAMERGRQGFMAGESDKARGFTTSERLGTQDYQAAEAQKGREFQAGENDKTRAFQELVFGFESQTAMAQLMLAFQQAEKEAQFAEIARIMAKGPGGPGEWGIVNMGVNPRFTPPDWDALQGAAQGAIPKPKRTYDIR